MESSPFIRQHEGIPEELVIIILSRLPIESLARFRCVSKLWRSLISDPKFILSSSHRIAVKAGYYPFDLFSFGAEEALLSDAILAKPMVGICRTYGRQILGSCNGLFLVLQNTHDLYLWNPTTRQRAKMLSMACGVFRFRFDVECGVGLCYDSNCDDYKAVMVGRGLVMVASFKRKSWAIKTCGVVRENFRESRNESWHSGPVVNEKLHWVFSPRFSSYNYLQTRVVYFDPLTEGFAELPMPLLTDNGKHMTFVGGVGVLKGYLCMTRCVFQREDEHNYDSEYDRKGELAFIEVLVMKEHGVGQSWTSSFIISNNHGFVSRSLYYYGSLVPLFLTKNCGILFLVHGRKFVVYNPDEMSQRDIHIRFQLDHFRFESYEASYVENLASPADYAPKRDWRVEVSDDALDLLDPVMCRDTHSRCVSPYWRVEVFDAFHLLYRVVGCQFCCASPYAYCASPYAYRASPYAYLVSDNEHDDYVEEHDDYVEEHDDYVFNGFGRNGKDKERFIGKAKARRGKEKKQKAQRRIKAKSKLTCKRKNQRKYRRREMEDLSKQVLDLSVN